MFAACKGSCDWITLHVKCIASFRRLLLRQKQLTAIAIAGSAAVSEVYFTVSGLCCCLQNRTEGSRDIADDIPRDSKALSSFKFSQTSLETKELRVNRVTRKESSHSN